MQKSLARRPECPKRFRGHSQSVPPVPLQLPCPERRTRRTHYSRVFQMLLQSRLHPARCQPQSRAPQQNPSSFTESLGHVTRARQAPGRRLQRDQIHGGGASALFTKRRSYCDRTGAGWCSDPGIGPSDYSPTPEKCAVRPQCLCFCSSTWS